MYFLRKQAKSSASLIYQLLSNDRLLHSTDAFRYRCERWGECSFWSQVYVHKNNYYVRVLIFLLDVTLWTTPNVNDRYSREFFPPNTLPYQTGQPRLTKHTRVQQEINQTTLDIRHWQILTSKHYSCHYAWSLYSFLINKIPDKTQILLYHEKERYNSILVHPVG